MTLNFILGKGNINFDATGISNVGRAKLDIGVNDGGINLPGLSLLFGMLFI